MYFLFCLNRISSKMSSAYEIQISTFTIPENKEDMATFTYQFNVGQQLLEIEMHIYDL